MKPLAKTTLPTEYGEFTMLAFTSQYEDFPHIALLTTNEPDSIPLVRIHSECMTGDIFQSKRCDCGDQLSSSLEQIVAHGGILLYLRQEGRGIGIVNKMHAYNLQDVGFDTLAANEELGLHQDSRDFSIAAKILEHLEISSIRLLTNNPRKIADVEAYGIKVAERVAIEITPTDHNSDYLRTKKERFGHILDKHLFVKGDPMLAFLQGANKILAFKYKSGCMGIDFYRFHLA